MIGGHEVKNGIILALADYLYTEHIEQKDLPALPREYLDNENEISSDLTSTTEKPTTTTEKVTSTTTWKELPANWVKRENCQVVEDQTTLFKRVVVCVEEYVDPESPEGREWLKSKEVRKEDF